MIKEAVQITVAAAAVTGLAIGLGEVAMNMDGPLPAYDLEAMYGIRTDNWSDLGDGKLHTTSDSETGYTEVAWLRPANGGLTYTALSLTHQVHNSFLIDHFLYPDTKNDVEMRALGDFEKKVSEDILTKRCGSFRVKSSVDNESNYYKHIATFVVPQYTCLTSYP